MEFGVCEIDLHEEYTNLVANAIWKFVYTHTHRTCVCVSDLSCDLLSLCTHASC